jgi:hypothetical protein
MVTSRDCSLPEGDIWNGYYQRRRYWFLGGVPALLLVLGLNLFQVSVAGLAVVMVGTLTFIAILVVVGRNRIRRLARGLMSGQGTFSTEAVLLGDAIIGTGEPWESLRAASHKTQLGLAGLLLLDSEGLYWISSNNRLNLKVHLRPMDVDRFELQHLGWWMSGLGVWTANGERLGILLPRVDREMAERSIARFGRARSSG